jgi:hypothetical protein
METTNRFADGEDAYNNKRGRSPEVDKTSRQRQRYRNGDNHEKRNQIAAGYDERNEESYENIEFPTREQGKGEAKVLGSFGRRYAIWPLSHPLCLPRWEKSFQPPDEGLQNLPKVAKRHGFKPRSTTGSDEGMTPRSSMFAYLVPAKE